MARGVAGYGEKGGRKAGHARQSPMSDHTEAEGTAGGVSLVGALDGSTSRERGRGNLEFLKSHLGRS